MRYLVSIGMLALLFGCGTDPLPQATATPTSSQLRIINNSKVDFKNLVLIFPTQRIEFGDVAAGATSEYVPVSNGVYNYSAFSVDIDGKHYDQPVTDWIGERPMAGYKFSYTLNFDHTAQPFVIRLESAVHDE